VTIAGTDAAEVLLEDRETTIPPAGASAVSVTVPSEELPPATEFGFKDKEASVAVVIVSVADWDVPFTVPVIVAPVIELTPVVMTVNVAVF